MRRLGVQFMGGVHHLVRRGCSRIAHQRDMAAQSAIPWRAVGPTQVLARSRVTMSGVMPNAALTELSIEVGVGQGLAD